MSWCPLCRVHGRCLPPASANIFPCTACAPRDHSVRSRGGIRLRAGHWAESFILSCMTVTRSWRLEVNSVKISEIRPVLLYFVCTSDVSDAHKLASGASIRCFSDTRSDFFLTVCVLRLEKERGVFTKMSKNIFISVFMWGYQILAVFEFLPVFRLFL